MRSTSPLRSGRRAGVMVISRALLLLLLTGLVLVAGAVRADAAPTPTPTPSGPVSGAACAAKAPGSVAWCMPWAVHVDTPAKGGSSHWVTVCSKATSDADRRSCAAASINQYGTPRDATASVLMDGPSTGAGPTGLINCAAMLPVGYNPDAHTQPGWDLKYNLCQQQVSAWAAQMYDPDPKPPDCSITDVNCKVQRGAAQALDAGIRNGVQGLVDMAVQSVVFLLSKMAGWIFTVTAISSPDAAFYSTYNSVAGVMVLLVFVFFILSTVINGLRTSGGPSPVASLGGLVRAVLGITFAGGIAYTIVAAWDQATNAVIAANARTPYDPSKLVTAFSDLTGGAGTMFLALLLAVLATVGLILLFIIMLFRGLLATGAALFGAVAMSGQAMQETRHWGRRWFWTVNALGSSKFFITELWIYGSRSAYGSDSLGNALRGVLLIWLMVVAPWILLRLTTLWDGYLSDVNAHGILASVGGPLQAGAAIADKLPFGGGSSGGEDGGSPASGAAQMMNENTANMPASPGQAAEAAAGVGDGTSRQVADAASTGGDGGQVGQTANDPGAEQGQNGAGDSPNAEEADGIRAGANSAQHDVNAGQLTAPGDATGNQGSLPVTPGAAQNADPTGGSGASTGTGASGAGEAAGAAGGTETGGSAADPAGSTASPGTDPAGAPSTSSGPSAAPAEAPAGQPNTPPHDEQAADHTSGDNGAAGGGAPGGGGAAGGGAASGGEAAAAAAAL